MHSFGHCPNEEGGGPWSFFSFVHRDYQVAGPTTLLHGGRHHDHGGALEGGGESPKVSSSMILTTTRARGREPSKVGSGTENKIEWLIVVHISELTQKQ